MNDRNVPPINAEHDDFPGPDRGTAHVEKENITSIKTGLHAATQDHHNLPAKLAMWMVITLPGRQSEGTSKAACIPMRLVLLLQSLTGDSLFVTSMRDFQITRALQMIKPASHTGQQIFHNPTRRDLRLIWIFTDVRL